MINIIKKQNMEEKSNRMDMRWVGEHVEEPFKELVKKNSEIFRDEKSLAIMEAIDGASRTGEFGVVTPLGKSCITCLSSGCKAGLLMMYYNSVEIIPVVSSYIAGDNVWKWLNDNTGITLAAGLESEIHLKQLRGEKTLDLWHEHIEEDSEAKEVTPEKEAVAYEKYIAAGGGCNNRLVMAVEEHVSYPEFSKRFEKDYSYLLETDDEESLPDDDVFIDDYDFEEKRLWRMAQEYTVINRIPSMSREANCRKLPVFWFWDHEGEPQMSQTLTVKYPDVTEILYPEFMEGFYCYDRERNVLPAEMDNGKLTAVIFDTEEVFYSNNYYRWIWFAVTADMEAKTLTLYDKEEAIEIFHKKMQEI